MVVRPNPAIEANGPGVFASGKLAAEDRTCAGYDSMTAGNAPSAMTSTARLALLLVLAMCAFAANSVFCRLALANTAIDPATFTAIRLGAGAAILPVLAYATGERGVGGSWTGALALLVYAVFFSFAYVSLTTATGALLLFGAVQATMILSGLLSGERLRLLQWTGFALAVAGLLALLAPGASAPAPLGAALMLAAGIAWGVYSLLGRGAGSPLATTAGNFVRAAPLSLAALLLVRPQFDAWGMLWAVLSGALASGVGYALWYAALPHLTATRAASIQLSVPVIAALGGIVVLGETLTLRLVLASATVLGGIALVLRGRATGNP